MAASLKTRGLDEARSLRKRIRRQHALGRISNDDRDYLDDLIENIIYHIEVMKEEEYDQTESDNETR